MATYERETRIDASLDDVWQFHSTSAGLERLTPDWMGLRVESTMGPDGDSDPEVLEAGSELSLSIRPFGVGPRQYWTSVITQRVEKPGRAYFVDEMVHGPFKTWVHTHSFFADGSETVLRDHVEYELPVGGFTDPLSPFSELGFEGMFRDRHARTREALESTSTLEPPAAPE